MLDRRTLIAGALALVIASSTRAAEISSGIKPRQRIIIDNDFGGDPDGLFQTAHHLLSPSVDIRLLIGSHLPAGMHFGLPGPQAAHAADQVTELLDTMGLVSRPRVVAGAEVALASTGRVAHTDAAEAIIKEAMEGDQSLPLYYCAGAGLTDLATAWLLEPRIARRLRLLWIGGAEYAGIAPPPGPREVEFNMSIDLRAAQVVFNRSDIDIWQVPRSTYRQMIVSRTELGTRLQAAGRLGAWLLARLDDVQREVETQLRIRFGETYVLGDSPLLTLTALQSAFQPDPASSSYVLQPRHSVRDNGFYGKAVHGRPIRVYTHIDARLTFEDMYAKFAAHKPS